MQRTATIVILFVAIACASCVHSQHNLGTPIDSSKVDRIKKGVTTESELLAIMGKPQMMQRTSNGINYTYMFVGGSHYGVIVPGASGDVGNMTMHNVSFEVKDGVVTDKSELISNMDAMGGTAIAPVIP